MRLLNSPGVMLNFSFSTTLFATLLPSATSGKPAVCPLALVPWLLALTWAVAVYSGLEKYVRTPAVAAVTITSRIGIHARLFKTRRYSRSSIGVLLLQGRLSDFEIDWSIRSPVEAGAPGWSAVGYAVVRASTRGRLARRPLRVPAAAGLLAARDDRPLPRAPLLPRNAIGRGAGAFPPCKRAALRPEQRQVARA